MQSIKLWLSIRILTPFTCDLGTIIYSTQFGTKTPLMLLQDCIRRNQTDARYSIRNHSLIHLKRSNIHAFQVDPLKFMVHENDTRHLCNVTLLNITQPNPRFIQLIQR